MVFRLRRDSGLGVHRQPPCSRSLHSRMWYAASSILSPVLGSNGRADRVGHQRRRSHVLRLVDTTRSFDLLLPVFAMGIGVAYPGRLVSYVRARTAPRRW